MNVHTHTEHRAAVTQRTTTKQKMQYGAGVARLRAYLDRGKYLRNPDQALSPDNLKTHREIADEVGYRSHRDVGRLIRREYPGLATVVAERQQGTGTQPVKKNRLFRYIEEGQHLRDPERELSADNLKTLQEIAREVGMVRSRASDHIREYFPDIAAIMTERGRRYRDHATH